MGAEAKRLQREKIAVRDFDRREPARLRLDYKKW